MSFKLGLSFKSFCLSKGKKKGAEKMILKKKIHSILGAGFLASWQGLFSIIQRKG